MMRIAISLGLLCLLSGPLAQAADSSTAAKNAAEAGQPEVTLSAAQMQDLGIAVRPLEVAKIPIQVQGFAVILDPSPLIQAAADIAAAQAAASASRAQADRMAALHRDDDTVSGQAAETAAATAAADQAKLADLRTTAKLTWGPALVGDDFSSSSSLVVSLTEGNSALVRAEFPAGARVGRPRQLTLTVSGLAQAVTATVLSPATGMNQMTDGEAFIARIDLGGNGAWAHPGLHLAASADGTSPPKDQVLVPRDAIVIADGTYWCYVAAGNGRFLRKHIEPAGGFAGDFVSASGIAAGASVVVAGAALLLAAEQRGLMTAAPTAD